MRTRVVGAILVFMGVFMDAWRLLAQQSGTQERTALTGLNRPDEPLRERYSPQAAVAFLDAVALDWQEENKCIACHTEFAYLIARPAAGWEVPAQRQIRAAAERIAEQGGLQAKDPARSSESVVLAAALAINDARTTRALHPATRKALDRMWTLPREDGAWTWQTQCQWPPSEIDEHYGVAVAALALGVAPGDYCRTPQAEQGLDKIRVYLSRHPPASTYERGMLLWASRNVDGILAEAAKKAAVEEFLSLQRPDGGWAFASLGNWRRSDGKPQDTQTSDGYGTAFAVHVLRMAGLPAEHPQIRKGVDWLKTHQRASGRWYTRSARKDSKHYVTHEGTAFAVMALAECDAVR